MLLHALVKVVMPPVYPTIFFILGSQFLSLRIVMGEIGDHITLWSLMGFLNLDLYFLIIKWSSILVLGLQRNISNFKEGVNQLMTLEVLLFLGGVGESSMRNLMAFILELTTQMPSSPKV